nr:uncharacterized protein LOC111517539 [Leptinotarsa decemlineata]
MKMKKDNLTILHQLKGVIEERDGDKYIKVGSYATSALVDFITIEYENLYNGTNPEMAERAGSYINATAPYIMANMSHYVEDFLAGVFKSHTNLILESTPVSILFPID